MSTRISLRLPSELLGRVDEAAKQAGLSRTAYVCRALERSLPDAWPETSPRSQEPLGSLAGVVCGGPPDLAAEHRRYLRQQVGDRR